MSSLDTKLKKILREYRLYYGSAVEPDAIAQIKQAFAHEECKLEVLNEVLAK